MSNTPAWECECGNHDIEKIIVVKQSKINKGAVRAYCRICGDEIIGIPQKTLKDILKGYGK